jgi:transposase
VCYAKLILRVGLVVFEANRHRWPAGEHPRPIGKKPDLTLNDLVGELADQHGIAIHRVSVWRFLRGIGLTHKKRPASHRAEAA